MLTLSSLSWDSAANDYNIAESPDKDDASMEYPSIVRQQSGM